jgi:hypothetical protein
MQLSKLLFLAPAVLGSAILDDIVSGAESVANDVTSAGGEVTGAVGSAYIYVVST